MADGDQYGDSNGPKKIKLLLDEELGVGASVDSSQVQLVDPPTTPNQNIITGPTENVQNDSPTLISADSIPSAENIQDLSSAESEENAPVIVEVLYYGINGIVMEETVGQPQDASEINADLSHSIMAEPGILQQDDNPVSDISNTGDPSSADSTPEVVIQQNGVSNPSRNIDSSDGNQLVAAEARKPECLRTLARAAAMRMLRIQDEAGEATGAAAGIATTPLEAQLVPKRYILIERGRNLLESEVFVRKPDNVPHRGPRRKYLTELEESQNSS